MSTEELKYLFIDDAFIESLEGIKKGVVPAKKVSDEPLIELDQPWEKQWVVGSGSTVVYDEEEKLFKMWYNVDRRKDVYEQASGLAYALSEDGIHWRKPILNLFDDKCYLSEATGNKKNNLHYICLLVLYRNSKISLP